MSGQCSIRLASTRTMYERCTVTPSHRFAIAADKCVDCVYFFALLATLVVSFARCRRVCLRHPRLSIREATEHASLWSIESTTRYFVAHDVAPSLLHELISVANASCITSYERRTLCMCNASRLHACR